MATQASKQDGLPGYTLPLNFVPDSGRSFYFDPENFPTALDGRDIDAGYIGTVKTIREITMMQIMNAITDKPDWDKKVFKEEITSKWRQEAMESGKDVSPKMMDWVIEELKYKAPKFQATGFVTAFDGDVVKADAAVSKELKAALQQAVRSLEDSIPEGQKDYHPGSGEKVVDLVHPSLFPLVYGRSRILKDAVVGLDDFLSWSGSPEVIPVPSEEEANARRASPLWRGADRLFPFSQRFQWLPCNVEFKEPDGCCIVSYINNLRPDVHHNLYSIIEKIIAQTIPLWNRTLTPVQRHFDASTTRIVYTEADPDDSNTPEPDAESDEGDSEEFWSRHAEWQSSRLPKQPEPDTFNPAVFPSKEEYDLRTRFQDKGFQAIVKLANVELTPAKPRYEGGSWHVEGQMNEHICATAIYYYSCENITENTLSFRQRVSTDLGTEVAYEQEYHAWLPAIFGCDGGESTDNSVTQDLGSITTREGRLLTFPNIFQHRVSPFELADPSKPGHRKILALFLVDPHFRVISTANIPPQQADWWKSQLRLKEDFLVRRLPLELLDMVMDNMDGFPISMAEAKQLRLELMEERKTVSHLNNEQFETGSFSLCEH